MAGLLVTEYLKASSSSELKSIGDLETITERSTLKSRVIGSHQAIARCNVI